MKGVLNGDPIYSEISQDLIGCDEEDGGAEYKFVVQDKSTLKYFSFITNDWEISSKYIGENDYDNEILIVEVQKKERVEIYYE